ncbi:hypothetical protein [Paenibacillus luteus]|uniref:hypothetical protein n=1 Tax=Paenibacillus luteus TaxID=2545753 RepID=UPI0019D62BFB|nr:hypothetical protein [Paenibacillus luteus]
MAVYVLLNLINDPKILLYPEERYFQANLLAGIQKRLPLNPDRSGCAGEINKIGGFDNGMIDIFDLTFVARRVI